MKEAHPLDRHRHKEQKGNLSMNNVLQPAEKMASDTEYRHTYSHTPTKQKRTLQDRNFILYTVHICRGKIVL